MNLKLILGVAAAAGLAYFLTTPKGKDLLCEIGDSFSDLYGQGEDVLKDVSKKVVQRGQDIANGVPKHFNV